MRVSSRADAANSKPLTEQAACTTYTIRYNAHMTTHSSRQFLQEVMLSVCPHLDLLVCIRYNQSPVAIPI
jgi:hypothetical protein